MKMLLLVLVLACVPVPALAYCSEPSFSEDPPDAPGSYSRPDVPFCLQEYQWSGTHTCDSWELDSYKADVEDYVQRLNTYLEEANSFAEEAVEYAEDAAAYARCEADDVVSQHK